MRVGCWWRSRGASRANGVVDARTPHVHCPGCGDVHCGRRIRSQRHRGAIGAAAGGGSQGSRAAGAPAARAPRPDHRPDHRSARRPDDRARRSSRTSSTAPTRWRPTSSRSPAISSTAASSVLRDAVAPLAKLRARHGVFFVTGNHEYFSGADAWLNELQRLGIRVLRNERVSIGEGRFQLRSGRNRRSHRPSIWRPRRPAAAVSRALEGRDPKRELVLLAHQPRSLFDAAPFGVGLQISGHTHGGQIWPFGYLVRLQQPFVAGPASPRRRADLRQPRHRLLGPAHAPGRSPPRSRT